MIGARAVGRQPPSRDGAAGQPRVREVSAKKCRWFRFGRDIASGKPGCGGPEISEVGPANRCGYRPGGFHRRQGRRGHGCHAAGCLALLVVMARRTGLGHGAVGHVGHRNRLAVRHQDARCSNCHPIRGKTEKEAKAQQMAQKLQHARLMRRGRAGVNSIRARMSASVAVVWRRDG